MSREAERSGAPATGGTAPLERAVRVPNAAGLHARPCHAIATLVGRYQGELRVSCDGQEADGRSVLSLMTLCAPCESTLVLRASGPDALELLAAVEKLVLNGFGEMT